ncbi:MAG: ATP-binding protein [Bryobacteraceae bacterium]
MSRFRISIESDLAAVFVVSVLVRGVCEHLGMDSAETSSIEICAVEAVTNSIKHAYDCAHGREVCVELLYTQDRLRLVVQDDGVSMPDQHRRTLTTGSNVFGFDPADLDRIPECGMGLEIIRQAMDEISYSTIGGTNSLNMTKFLRKREPQGILACNAPS